MGGNSLIWLIFREAIEAGMILFMKFDRANQDASTKPGFLDCEPQKQRSFLIVGCKYSPHP